MGYSYDMIVGVGISSFSEALWSPFASVATGQGNRIQTVDMLPVVPLESCVGTDVTCPPPNIRLATGADTKEGFESPLPWEMSFLKKNCAKLYYERIGINSVYLLIIDQL